MDRLTSMAVFTKVVEANSFSAAARDLGISQATASKHVQVLETWLGARLLNRTTRRVGMTELGERFYAHCTRVLGDVEEMRATSRRETGLRGVLRVAAPLSFGSTRLGAILQGFAQLHPLLAVEVFLSDRAVDPVEDGFDVALRLGAVEGSGLAVRRLAALPVVLVAAPAYLGRRGTPSSLAALAAHACLLDRSLFPQGWRFGGVDGNGAPRLAYGIAANSGLVLRDAAAAGAGLLLAPAFLVEAELRAGRLVRLLPDAAVAPLELAAAMPANRSFSGRVGGFASYLAERLAAA